MPKLYKFEDLKNIHNILKEGNNFTLMILRKVVSSEIEIEVNLDVKIDFKTKYKIIKEIAKSHTLRYLIFFSDFFFDSKNNLFFNSNMNMENEVIEIAKSKIIAQNVPEVLVTEIIASCDHLKSNFDLKKTIDFIKNNEFIIIKLKRFNL